MASVINQVAELQGLYGPFTMAERVVQKIWLHCDLDQTRAALTDGRKLEIRSTGAWNLLGGPDFRGARIAIDRVEIKGDVEMHFHASDWQAHGHAHDPAYDDVALHVVLFPLSTGEKPARHRDGRAIPTLVLLPLLHRDLEEYASDDALEVLTAREEWRYLAELAGQPIAELKQFFQAKARDRWCQKVHFARVRLEKLGFAHAAHQMALEILGYRQNRAVMLTVAAKYPPAAWLSGVDLAAIFAENRSRWQLQGQRPANHPLRRLRQYQSWVKARPDWAEQMLGLFADLPAQITTTTPTREARHCFQLSRRRATLVEAVTGDTLRGTRFDTVLCDGILPLLTAKTGIDGFPLWFHWFLGDLPDLARRVLPKLGLADGLAQPLCQGYAQGLLSWFLETERRASG